MSGWLTKLGYDSGKWQLRYFVLTKDHLAYYNDLGGKEKGRILTANIEGAETVSPGSKVERDGCSTSLQHAVPGNAFKVYTRTPGGWERSFYMFSDSEDQSNTWIRHIGPPHKRKEDDD